MEFHISWKRQIQDNPEKAKSIYPGDSASESGGGKRQILEKAGFFMQPGCPRPPEYGKLCLSGIMVNSAYNMFAESRTLTSSPKISEFHLSSLSKLEYRMFIAEFGGKWSPSALILEFNGIYGNGSLGNGDADFINMVRAGLTTILDVEAVVYDFRNMEYEWGNRIWNVLACPREDGEDAITTAMVISDKCRKGFSTCVGMVPPIFDTIEEALAFVEPYARGYLDRQMDDVE